MADTPHILAADDSPPIREILKGHLERAGCRVTLANDGLDAVALYASPRIFDLVLLDMQMPGMGGYPAAHAIRTIEQQRQTRTTPIVVISGGFDDFQSESYVDHGINGTLNKPFTRNELLATVESYAFLPGNHQSDELPSRGPAHASCPIPLDFQAVMDDFGEDYKMFLKVLNLFLVQSQNHVVKIKIALQNQDSALLSQEAHTLFGGAAAITARPVASAAKELELIARNGDLDQVPSILGDLENELKRLFTHVKSHVVSLPPRQSIPANSFVTWATNEV